MSDTVSRVRGNHNIKFGIDYIHTNDFSENVSNYFGAYSYTSIANYLTDYYQSQNPATARLQGHYSTYNQGFGSLGFEFQTGDYAAFIQDEWKVRPRLSLTIGLRYEYEKTPSAQLPNSDLPLTSSFPSDKNNIAPRVGFAFDVFGKGKTVLRGGYGIFNARLINSTIYNALAQTGNPNGQFQTPNLTPTTGPLFPRILATGSGVTPNVIYFDPHFQLPQIHQADLAVNQELGWNTVLSVSWLGSFGHELPNFEDTNLPNPVPVTYTVVNTNTSAFTGLPNNATYTANLYGYPVNSSGKTSAGQVLRPNGKYGAITDIVSNVNSNYNALVFQVQHRFSHHVQFQSSYVVARS